MISAHNTKADAEIAAIRAVGGSWEVVADCYVGPHRIVRVTSGPAGWELHQYSESEFDLRLRAQANAAEDFDRLAKLYWSYAGEGHSEFWTAHWSKLAKGAEASAYRERARVIVTTAEVLSETGRAA